MLKAEFNALATGSGEVLADDTDIQGRRDIRLSQVSGQNTLISWLWWLKIVIDNADQRPSGWSSSFEVAAGFGL